MTMTEVLAGTRQWHVECDAVLPALRRLPDGCVHCCVTSPPYWRLRKYLPKGHARASEELGTEKVPDCFGWATGERCGACFVCRLTEVFREVRRVLHPSGTLWVNIAGSYTSNGGTTERKVSGKQLTHMANRAAERNMARYHGWKVKDFVNTPSLLAESLRVDGWYYRSEITLTKVSPMPNSVRDRPTSATEKLYLFAKGQWVSRVINFTDLPSEFVHLGKNFRLEAGHMGDAGEFCIRLASAILDSTQRKYDFCLPPFYSQEWQKGSADADSDFVRSLPMVDRAAVWASRFASAKATAKEFLHELYCLSVALSDGNDFLKGWVSADLCSPSLYADGKGAITVHHAGQICKFDFAHACIVLSHRSGCKYYYDQDAERVPASDNPVTAARRKRTDNSSVGHADLHGKDFGQSGKGSSDKIREAVEHGGRNLWDYWDDEPDYCDDTSEGVWEWRPDGGTSVEGHYASYPQFIPRRCYRLGASIHGVCPACNAPWVRVTERTKLRRNCPNEYTKRTGAEGTGNSCANGVAGVSSRTLGWEPTCGCGRADVLPPLVMDVFSGSGTSGVVARMLGMRYLGIELFEEYAEASRVRIARPPFYRPGKTRKPRKFPGLFDEA